MVTEALIQRARSLLSVYSLIEAAQILGADKTVGPGNAYLACVAARIMHTPTEIPRAAK